MVARAGSGLALAVAAVLPLSLCSPPLSPLARAEVQMPRRSPRGRVSQQVGLTEIAVDFDSPAVRGRALWGAAIPYDEIWRRGEIPAPKISFSRNVSVGDTAVPAGRYALLLVPSRDAWTVILNRRPDVMETARAPSRELDVARVKAHVTAAPFRERLAFLFSDFTDDRVTLDMEWESIRVSIPIKVFTRDQIVADIKALDGVGREYANAARYMLETKKDYQAGLKYADLSLALGENWYNVWVRASLLAATGAYQEAWSQADRAYDMGLKVGTDFFLEPEVRQALRTWNKAALRQVQSSARRRVAAATPPRATSDSPPLIAIVTDRSDNISTGLARPTATSAASTPPAATGPASPSERPVSLRRPSPGQVDAPAAATVDVSPVIRNGRADLKACYQRALRTDPSLGHGRITVSLTIGLDGHATRVSLTTPDALRVLEPCIKQAITRWSFPRSTSEYGVDFPLLLQSRED